MISWIRTIYVWTSFVLQLFIWFILMIFIRLFDRDPLRYKTGRFFRRLSVPLVKFIPIWRLHFSGVEKLEPRQPLVVVSNHQSLLDIPIVAYWGMETKWVAKKELFEVPLFGWMLKMAGDISLDRTSPRSGVQAMIAARKLLQGHYPVMFFPEGTRSLDGMVHEFSEGPFHLAIKTSAMVLPIAIEGAYACIPKSTLRFGPPRDVYVHVFPPIPTADLKLKQAEELKTSVRNMIVAKVAEWRNVSPETVDGLKSATEGSDR
jgi:1-acyl-sn-glycerol-3-phosphate acyltransferase